MESTATQPETAREHLRNALQAMTWEGKLEMSEALAAMGAAERRIRAALAILDQVHGEALSHPFSFARHVADVV